MDRKNIFYKHFCTENEKYVFSVNFNYYFFFFDIKHLNTQQTDREYEY